MSCLHQYSGLNWWGGWLGCGLILFTLQRALQCGLSAAFRGSSRSALLTVCWRVRCDYSPCRQKKEGEISSPVVSDLHTLPISSALVRMRPSAPGHLQQLEPILFYMNESNTSKTKYRQWFSVNFSFHFALRSPPVSSVRLRCSFWHLISPLTHIMQTSRAVIWLALCIILCKCLHQQISIWMPFNIDFHNCDIIAQSCVIFEISALLLDFSCDCFVISYATLFIRA